MQNQSNNLPPLDFEGDEDRDGVRFSWNYWPSSRLEATKMIIPFGVVFNPLRKVEKFHQVNYEAVKCRSCDGLLNPLWYFIYFYFANLESDIF